MATKRREKHTKELICNKDVAFYTVVSSNCKFCPLWGITGPYVATGRNLCPPQSCHYLYLLFQRLLVQKLLFDHFEDQISDKDKFFIFSILEAYKLIDQ